MKYVFAGLLDKGGPELLPVYAYCGFPGGCREGNDELLESGAQNHR